MALNKSEQAAIEALAAELEVAVTWVTGPRATRLGVLAKQARGIADGSVGAADIEAQGSATTAATAAAQAAADAEAAKQAAKDAKQTGDKSSPS